jgi:hypothetical protein
VKYELGFYIPEDDILHSHRRENLKSYKGISLMTKELEKGTLHPPLKPDFWEERSKLEGEADIPDNGVEGSKN